MVTAGGAPRTKIRFTGCFSVALAVCGVGAIARPAHGNGALPASLGVLLPADRAQEILLATNFGMILSDDGGQSWLWTCERDATSMGYLYTVGPPPRDRIYALSPEQGLSFSDDGTCTWQRAGGVLKSAIASDYFVDRTDGEHVLAVAATLDAGGDLLPQSLYASHDGGTSFDATVLVTALTTLPNGATNGVRYRSANRGDTFSPWVLSPQPHILGLAERDGVLYVAGKNYSDRWALATSDDEGATLIPRAHYEDVHAIKPCAQQTCAATCDFEVMAAVWSSAVCTSGPTPPVDPGCGCSAARPGGGAAVLAVGMVLAAVLRRRSNSTSARRSARQCRNRSVD